MHALRLARRTVTRLPVTARSFGVLSPTDTFVGRHNGPHDADIAKMLATIGLDSLDAMVTTTVPK